MSDRRAECLILLMFLTFSGGCEKSRGSSPRDSRGAEPVTFSWQGEGNRTLGFPSESGVFQISWKSFDPKTPGDGTLQVTVRSAISGRPIRIVVDQKGEGAGSVDFADDPRLYELLVDSAGLKWTISVVEGASARQ
jgi:hypothetical protein